MKRRREFQSFPEGAAVKLPAARNCILLKSAGTSTAGRNGSSGYASCSQALTIESTSALAASDSVGHASMMSAFLGAIVLHFPLLP